MRKAFRHTGVLMMVAVVALGLLGAGFALWFQVLTFNASVTTGNLDVQWSNHGTSKVVSLDQGATFGDPAPGKMDNVSCSLLPGPSDGSSVGHTLTLTVSNLFPFAGCDYGVDITNTGTVPVHVDIPGALAELQTAAAGLPFGFDDSNCTAPRPAENNGQFQVHAGESLQCTFRIWLLQAAAENTTYSFTTHVIARQYNEDSALLPGVTRVWSAGLNYNGAGGWAGWSCPTGHAVGGGVSGTSGTITPSIPMAVSEIASPGNNTYPFYPHHTFGAGETGWVAQDGGTAGTAYIYVDCAP